MDGYLRSPHRMVMIIIIFTHNNIKGTGHGRYEFKLPFWVYNQIYMKYILCQRRRVYAGKKEVFLFLYKHVKKGHVPWYIHSIGEWETCQKTLLWILFFFFCVTTKKPSPL